MPEVSFPEHHAWRMISSSVNNNLRIQSHSNRNCTKENYAIKVNKAASVSFRRSLPFQDYFNSMLLCQRFFYARLGWIFQKISAILFCVRNMSDTFSMKFKLRRDCLKIYPQFSALLRWENRFREIKRGWDATVWCRCWNNFVGFKIDLVS